MHIKTKPTARFLFSIFSRTQYTSMKKNQKPITKTNAAVNIEKNGINNAKKDSNESSLWSCNTRNSNTTNGNVANANILLGDIGVTINTTEESAIKHLSSVVVSLKI